MKVLVATDGSEHSEGAVRFVSGMDFKKDDEIVLIHVLSEMAYEDESLLKFELKKKAIGKKILESSMNILEPVKAKKRALLGNGYPDSVIMDEAKDEAVDLIVMGASGVHGVQLLVLGSSTRSVAINHVGPLLVVRQPQWERKGPVKILHATDGSLCAHFARKMLLDIPFHPDSEIRVLHVTSSPMADIPEKYRSELGEGLAEAVDREVGRKAKTAVEEINSAIEVLGAKYPKISGIVRNGSATGEILNCADEIHADVIAIGCRGLRGIKRMLGSVSRTILGNAKCSVLLGRDASCA